MSEDFLGLLGSDTAVVTLASGEALFNKGEPGHLMYVVKSGYLQILDGNYVYETVSVGSIVGEMLQLLAELVLLRRYHGDRRGNIRLRRLRGFFRCRRLRRCRSLGHRRGHGRRAFSFPPPAAP